MNCRAKTRLRPATTGLRKFDLTGVIKYNPLCYLPKVKGVYMYREEKPERRIHSAPGAMRNPEGVSYKAKRKRSRYSGVAQR